MGIDAFVERLDALFGVDGTANRIRALRQDELVWAVVNDAAAIEKAIEACGNEPEAWTPARIAISAIGDGKLAKRLAADPMLALESDLRQTAVRTYEDVRKKGRYPVDLREAGLLGLALRERRRLTGSWKGLADELVTAPSGVRSMNPAVWKSAIACLAGFVHDPQELFRELIGQGGSDAGLTWLLHAYATHPEEQAKVRKAVEATLRDAPAAAQLAFLKALAQCGFEDEARKMASRLLEHPSVKPQEPSGQPIADVSAEGLARQLLAHQQRATLHQLAGNPAQAEAALEAAWQVMKQWDSGLRLQQTVLQAADADKRDGAAWRENLQALGHVDAGFASQVGMLCANPATQGIDASLLDIDLADPILKIFKSEKLSAGKDKRLSNEIALSAANRLIEALREGQWTPGGDFNFTWEPTALLAALDRMKLYPAEAQLADLLIARSPADLGLLVAGRRAHKNQGNLRRARELAELAQVLDRDAVEHVRELATLHEKLADWQDARRQRKQVLDMEGAAAIADQIAYANAALEAGEIEEASNCCEALLAQDADLGAAHGLLGLARQRQGQVEAALMHLNRATLVSPEVDRWWLALAELYDAQEDGQAALNVLRTAVLAAPESAGVHYNLGVKYLENGQNAEALSHLKLAAAAHPEDEVVAFKLSKAFRALGHLAEAKSAIDPLRVKWSADPAVAYEYGCITLGLGDVKSALPALEAAANAAEAQPDWLKALAEVQLDEGIAIPAHEMSQRYQHAEKLLRQALELQPDDHTIRLLLAEAVRRSGQLEAAYELYQELAESQEVTWQDLLWKVQHGLGLTAIGLGQVEPGIALLREASQSRPGELAILQDLTQVCLDAQLEQDAEEAAEKALEIAPDNLENLDWFAKVMLRLGKQNRAAEALRFAIELTPAQTDLRVRYAQLELENGSVENAREALVSLPELEDVDASILRKAAYLHLRMQDYPRAIEELEKAVMLTETPPPDLLYELAQVYSKNERFDDALRVVEKAAEDCRDVRMHTFHADLLARQERYQSAIAVAEKGAKIALEQEACSCDALLDIYNRLSAWQRALGNVASAYEQAEKALALAPDDIDQRYRVAELAAAMLQEKKAARYALQPYEAANLVLNENGLRLAALSALLAIDDERAKDAQDLLVVCKAVDANDPWVQTVEARLLALNGEIGSAGQLVDEATRQIKANPKQARAYMLWTARAAREVYRWESSFELLREYQAVFPSEHRGAYELCAALVEAAEAGRVCDALNISAHAPHAADEASEIIEQFDAALESVEPFLSPEEVIRWNTRAKLAWQPSPEALQAFSMASERSADRAAAMAGLRALAKGQEAIELAEAHADNPSVKLQQVLALAENGQPGELQRAEELVADQPNHPLLLAAFARLAEKHGKADVAYAALDGALEAWPDEEGWQAWAARLAHALGDVKTSILHWQKALALRPDEAAYSAALGEALFDGGDYPLAEELMQKAVALNPNDADSWAGLAQAQAALGKSDQAIGSALKASEIDASGVQGMILASKIAQEMGNMDDALQHARSAIQRKPDDIDAIVNLSQILRKQGAVAESLEVIERSLQDQPPCKDLLVEHARLLHTIYGPSAAAEHVNKLSQAYPDEADVLALHATIQAELGDLKTAERSAFRSLRLDPNQPNLALTLGKMTRKAGQLDQAVHILSQAAVLDSHNIDVYLELGQTYSDRREHQKALEVFQRAIQIAPRDPRGYYQAALIMKDTKDYMGAENLLEQAARFAPEDLQVHRQLVGVMALNLIHKSQEANTAL